MSTAEFEVDPDRLQALALRLRRVSVTLGEAGHPKVDAEAAGSEELAVALDDFAKGWSKSFDDITDDIAEVGRLLDSAAREYTDAEGKLNQTFSTGTYERRRRTPDRRR